MSTPTIQRYQDIDQEWRWRLLGSDGHPLADGTIAFADGSALGDHLDWLRGAILSATIVTDPDAVPSSPTIVIHEGTDDEWRWRFEADADHVADSGEGYATVEAAIEAAERTQSAITNATISTWNG